MKTFEGLTVCPGTAIGRIKVLGQGETQAVRRIHIDDADEEIKRYCLARDAVSAQLCRLHDKALQEIGPDAAAIFEVHQMMIEDEGYNDFVIGVIRSRNVNAEFAVAAASDKYSSIFDAMEDEYMRDRAADVRDISRRLIENLNGCKEAVLADGPVIIVATDLAPSMTVQLDRSKVLAFVLSEGSSMSHTAILARTMGIPALIRTGMALGDETFADDIDGKFGAVDGTNARFYADVDDATVKILRSQQDAEREERELLATLRGKDTVTADGRKVMLYANISNVSDLDSVIANGADGIGLFRSEFIYLDRQAFPTEDEQFTIYKKVAQTMAGKRVIIRTLDIGADKSCDYFEMPAEQNPAMGMRAIRMCLAHPDIFKAQLRSLLRASVYGDIAIMYPMIANMWEVRKIKEIIGQVKDELRAEGIPHGSPLQGIMIETPAAAIISDELAREVDFFSIGTNDLTQYTLAADRQNAGLGDFMDTHHPAVLRLIKTAVHSAHMAGIRVGICGELAADTSLTKTFIQMGVDDLSVSPAYILPLRKQIREMTVE